MEEDMANDKKIKLHHDVPMTDLPESHDMEYLDSLNIPMDTIEEEDMTDEEIQAFVDEHMGNLNKFQSMLGAVEQPEEVEHTALDDMKEWSDKIDTMTAKVDKLHQNKEKV